MIGDLQHLPRGRVQAVEPGPDGLTHRRGDRPAGRSAGRRPLAPELGDEERVAAGDALDPGCIGGTGRAASHGSQQPGDSLRVEAAEQEPFGRSPPQQVGEHLGEPRPGPGIAVGRHQQRRELADPAGKIGEQDQRGLVGQVDVVEHDEHPVCLASGSEQGDHRVEGPLAGLGIGQRVRRQPVPACRSSQQRLEPRRRMRMASDQGSQNVEPRSEGNRAIAVEAVTPARLATHGSRVIGHGSRQPGLADTRLTRAQDEPTASACRFGNPASQRRDLVVPSQERDDGPDITTGRPHHGRTVARHGGR